MLHLLLVVKLNCKKIRYQFKFIHQLIIKMRAKEVVIIILERELREITPVMNQRMS